MQWGITLNLKSDFDRSLWSLPPPSGTRWLSKMDGTKTLQVLYHFQYTPQSWKEWQRVASIKIQMKQKIPQLIFSEYEGMDEIQIVYTIAELGKYFTEFVKYQKPLYPSNKDKFMSSLTLYCQRLHYEEQLHIEAVIAIAFHFNSKCGFKYSHREIMKKAKSMFNLDMSKWKVKLSANELKEAYSDRNLKIAEVKREKSQPKREEALKLRASGKTLNAISEILGISFSTTRRYVSK